MDANKTTGEEARWQLHKNAACNPEQVLAATPHKTPTVRPPTPYHENYHAGHCWRSRDELIRDVLLWIPTHGRAKAGRPARTYIQQLCEDTGCCPEDLPRAMNDREEWRERVRDIRATSARWWWWWWYIKDRQRQTERERDSVCMREERSRVVKERLERMGMDRRGRHTEKHVSEETKLTR